MGDIIDSRLHEPSVEEREAGYHMARFADAVAKEKPQVRERCHDCVFRFGTVANTSGVTVLNATKCALEREPFYCVHEPKVNGEEPVCAGWALLVDAGAAPIPVPWDFIPEPDPPEKERGGPAP